MCKSWEAKRPGIAYSFQGLPRSSGLSKTRRDKLTFNQGNCLGVVIALLLRTVNGMESAATNSVYTDSKREPDRGTLYRPVRGLKNDAPKKSAATTVNTVELSNSGTVPDW